MKEQDKWLLVLLNLLTIAVTMSIAIVGSSFVEAYNHRTDIYEQREIAHTFAELNEVIREVPGKWEISGISGKIIDRN